MTAFWVVLHRVEFRRSVATAPGEWLCLGVTSLESFGIQGSFLIHTGLLYTLQPPCICRAVSSSVKYAPVLSQVPRQSLYLTIMCTCEIMRILPSCLMPTGSCPRTLLHQY